MRRFPSPREQGFTAIQFLTAVTIIAILTGFSLPFFPTVVRSYRFGGAVRRIMSDLRYTQSLAVTNGGCYGLHSGRDPLVNRPNEYRIEKGGCDGMTPPWPDATRTRVTNANVVTDWFNIGQEFPGVSLASLKDNAGVTVNGVIFNSRGASVNPFVGGLIHPITITVTSTSGETRTIQLTRTGSVRAL